ncbi:hypothetical protein [Williamsia serinedens]|uniref:Uncharacterized protein n=1 Tax=Williamsia serinedens TaxID=391736 RepID=A0ABT1H6M4_9NOCA|nr:hypothetical protein [Williamsia serinedens]MCP2162781.1 hypothetical protein [Williamsia serinedens]
MGVEFNDREIERMLKDVEKKVSKPVDVPTTGSEAAAVRKIKDELKRRGVTPNDAEIKKMVRDNRKGK